MSPEGESTASVFMSSTCPLAGPVAVYHRLRLSFRLIIYVYRVFGAFCDMFCHMIYEAFCCITTALRLVFLRRLTHAQTRES